METSTQPLEQLRTGYLPGDGVLFGRSAAMQELKARCDLAAPTDVPLLIRGESGTGKELLARYLHLNSGRAIGPFLRMNCAAIPEALLETELFGHERGAFTGAHDVRPGKVELAVGGTLFLDEIGEMPLSLQAKLLHLLQDGRYSRIGGLETRQAKVRIICATNRDLEQAVLEKGFRQDLFYRIDVLGLHLPPLRERVEDLETLTTYLLGKAATRLRRPITPLSESTLRRLSRWNWPGNIRELENWVARYVVLGLEDIGSQAAIPAREREEVPHGAVQLKRLSREAAIAAEREMILRSLDAHRWNKRRVARDLQISYRGLLYKIRAAGIGRNRADVNGERVENL